MPRIEATECPCLTLVLRKRVVSWFKFRLLKWLLWPYIEVRRE